MERRLGEGWRDIHLSENFTLGEMVVSANHPELLIDFIPSIVQVTNISILTRLVLQPVRDRFGIIKVTSAIVTPELNEKRGGKIDSQHLAGEAADIVPVTVRAGDVFDWLKNDIRWIGETLYYLREGHIHVALPVIWVHADRKIIQ